MSARIDLVIDKSFIHAARDLAGRHKIFVHAEPSDPIDGRVRLELEADTLARIETWLMAFGPYVLTPAQRPTWFSTLLERSL